MLRNVITCVSELVMKMMTLYSNDAIKLPNSCEEKILGVIIDSELKFNPHVRSMYRIIFGFFNFRYL